MIELVRAILMVLGLMVDDGNHCNAQHNNPECKEKQNGTETKK